MRVAGTHVPQEAFGRKWVYHRMAVFSCRTPRTITGARLVYQPFGGVARSMYCDLSSLLTLCPEDCRDGLAIPVV